MRSETEVAVSTAAITLMRGVVYRETHEEVWATLQRHGAPVRDHFATIGVDVVVDDNEGYAYLRAQVDDADELPRLVNRRSLSYPVSLLLVLLRKRMVEWESTSNEPRLILTREQIGEMLALFLADTSNEARQLDQVDATIKKVVDLGFLRALRGQRDTFEVRRILKAYVDAQTLADFAGKLDDYRLDGSSGGQP
ncbi:DUF4194 domain-containing protein [Nocardioides sp.]|uniref:DUF4194 domain-containing protein n=1 Tax=Nocardioides sp. TaxID=35761 RepID=UPI0023961483|nr:DUF4194 domain-containing protein [Nocardioides sp.]MDE0776142.1 DUF4194 domain-containing protein [Nocardioides sp.]